MDVDRLKSTRPKVYEAVWHACRTENHVALSGLKLGFAYIKVSASSNDDESLIVWVNMKAGTFTDHVRAIREHS